MLHVILLWVLHRSRIQSMNSRFDVLISHWRRRRRRRHATDLRRRGICILRFVSWVMFFFFVLRLSSFLFRANIKHDVSYTLRRRVGWIIYNHDMYASANNWRWCCGVCRKMLAPGEKQLLGFPGRWRTSTCMSCGWRTTTNEFCVREQHVWEHQWYDFIWLGEVLKILRCSSGIETIFVGSFHIRISRKIPSDCSAMFRLPAVYTWLYSAAVCGILIHYTVLGVGIKVSLTV